MSSPRSLPGSPGEALGSDPQSGMVGDYLDHLCAPLIGLVPYAERQSLRLEVEGHLYALIAEYEGEGFTSEAATAAALREHGEPWRIGRTFLDEWCRRAPQSRLARHAGIATLRAFAFSGIAALPVLLLIQVATLFGPSREPFTQFLTPDWLLFLMFTPWFTGLLTGVTTPVRPVPATIRGVGALILVSAATGLQMLPYTEGLYFALYQLLYWLPAGSLAAWLGATLAVCYRRQHFLNLHRRATRFSR
jgi:hypothetical protein